MLRCSDSAGAISDSNREVVEHSNMGSGAGIHVQVATMSEDALQGC